MSEKNLESAPGRRSEIIYVLYSETSERNLTEKLGYPEYSYFFVREAFRLLLETRARTIVVTDPETEVDAIYDGCMANGEECVFLSFAPPHRSFISIRCPTIPVFAWEFDTIPSEEWDSPSPKERRNVLRRFGKAIPQSAGSAEAVRTTPRNDWRKVLGRFGQAITHSAYSTQAVRGASIPNFSIETIPAPIWNRVRRSAEAYAGGSDVIELSVRCFLDTRQSSTLVRTKIREIKRTGPKAKLRSILKRIGFDHQSVARDEPAAKLVRFAQSEVIYTSIFNPNDGRKNWEDMLSAFCIACAKFPDATLVFKLIHHDSRAVLNEIRDMLARFRSFQCRVVVISDFLDDLAYQKLIAASKFAVNTSQCEGQCLPLMESMSWGKPALAPQHTGISEYMDESVGFLIDTSLEPCSWPHDPRGAVRAFRHRINWESVARAFVDSFEMIRTEPERYKKMSESAIEKQRMFCSEEVAFAKLDNFVRAALAEQKHRQSPEHKQQFSLLANQGVA